MPSSASGSQNPQHIARYEFLDLLRGVAVLLMVEGHAMRALLDHRIQATFAYSIHELIHGLPGPLFLFAAGAALAFTIGGRNGPQVEAPSKADAKRNWRRRLRLLNVLLIAYALQLSYFSLRQTISASTPEQVVFLLNFNVLQCIVVSVLALRWIASLAHSPPALVRVCTALVVVIGLTTPLIWAAAPHLPMWLGTLVSRQYGSYFPLFPYAGFTFGGAVWAVLLQLASRRREEARFLRRTILLGAAVILACIALARIPWPPLYSDFWWSSPWYLWLRIGLLAVLCAYFRRIELAAGTSPWPLRLLALLGRQSFYIYVAHLVLLYGSAFNSRLNMLHLLGADLPFWQSAAATALLACVMIASAWVWDWAKRTHAVVAHRVKWTLATFLLAVFVIS